MPMLRRLSLAFALILAVSPAWAQDATPKPSAPIQQLLMLQQYQPSHPEKILMAFHKISGIEADTLKWAKASPYLDKATEGDRDGIISREDNRLRRAYSEFDVNDPIIVHTRVNLDNYSTIQEVLRLKEFTAKTFFAYSLYGENVAIVPKDIANFNTIQINKAQMDEMLKKAGKGQIKAELLLKPVVADPKTPFVQNGASYLLLLAEIGEIRFWSDNGAEPKLLWTYRADWFKPKQDRALMDLKSGTSGF